MARKPTKLGRSRPHAAKRIKALSEKQTKLKEVYYKQPVFYRDKKTGRFVSVKFALENLQKVKEIKVSYRDKETGRFVKKTAPAAQEYRDKRRFAGYVRNPLANFKQALDKGALSKKIRPELDRKSAKLAIAQHLVARARWVDLGQKGDAPEFRYEIDRWGILTYLGG